MQFALLITAAGRGNRAGGGLAKQWRALAGARVIDHAFAPFADTPGLGPVCIALAPEDAAMAEAFRARGWLVVAGGQSRSASVRAGLEALAPLGPTHVLIHDAARPCATPALIGQILEALQSAPGAAPALPLTDALWQGGEVVEAIRPRAGLWRAQTPQGFDFAAILAAHHASDGASDGAAADDVEVALAAGMRIAIVPGEDDNLKITHPGDFARAERILGGRMQVRTGTGYDVHRFCAGDHVWLCGVRLAHGAGLEGHSDADVGMHALTDALYGALAEGDIGRHFPPTDPQWKGAASHIFLAHAAKLVREGGWRLSNADVTLICEAPKIGPHAAAMQDRLAEIAQVGPGRVSVKATTSERLGFTGRGEGIAALATATLMKG